MSLPSMTLIDRTGAIVGNFLGWIGAVSIFGARALRDVFRPPFELAETMRQLYEVGSRSAPLVSVSGFAIGVVLSLHTRASLERFGAEAMIPAGLAMALIKDTGPLTVALLVSGRVGAGIGAELGAMKVTEQIDALEATAVDSFKYLAVTRIVACMVAMPLLTTLTNFAGIFGGFFAEYVAAGISPELYFRSAFRHIWFADYVPATLKTTVFGFIIGTISSYLGFTTSGGTEGVGQASTRAVVLSSISIILVNVILVQLIFFFLPSARGG